MKPAINNGYKIRKKMFPKLIEIPAHWCMKKFETRFENSFNKLKNVPSILKTLKSKLENLK